MFGIDEPSFLSLLYRVASAERPYSPVSLSTRNVTTSSMLDFVATTVRTDIHGVGGILLVVVIVVLHDDDVFLFFHVVVVIVAVVLCCFQRCPIVAIFFQR